MSVAAMQRTYRYNAGASSPGGAPLWPFGFGLSYTSFAVSWRVAPPAGGLTVTAAAQSFTLQLTLANTGAVDGSEVVQVYVVPQAATLAPQPPYVPTRYVVAFARAPCASAQQVSVDITVDLVDALTITADVMGARTLVSGTYALVVNRGTGAGDELSVPVTVVA